MDDPYHINTSTWTNGPDYPLYSANFNAREEGKCCMQHARIRPWYVPYIVPDYVPHGNPGILEPTD